MVSGEPLHFASVEASLEEVGAERVPEDVRVGRRADPGLASDPGEGSACLEAVEVEHGPGVGCGVRECGAAAREPFVVDVEDGAVVAAFAADVDLGFAPAFALGYVDGADAERLADPESAQQQQHDKRSIRTIRPVSAMRSS